MKRYSIIAADLFAKNTGTADQIKSLRDQALYQHGLGMPEMTFSNEGCWRSQFKYQDMDWLLDEIRSLTNQAMAYYSQADPSYAKKVKHYGDAEIRYWTNVNDPGSRNALHNHQLHHYVALYYVDAEGTGDLVFHNPSNLTEGCNPYAPFVGRISWTPKNGDLLLWPSWMPHETDRNDSNGYRINIAFNIRFQTPQMIYD
jgi:hypothetical protein